MNGKFLIRGYAPADEAALTALWKRCFGDSEELIHGFFAMLPELGAGVTAELDGKPVGMAFAICGMALSSGEKCGYIYAVAVDESCRGFGAGAALTRAAADAARGLGAEIICTLPAEASLYPWYEKLISTRFTLCRTAVSSLLGRCAASICSAPQNITRGAKRSLPECRT